MLVSFYLDTLY